MNTVLIKINSYAQSAQLFINGQEPSLYSEMSNFTYKQYLQTPDGVLDAIARELNDDFTLSVRGNAFEMLLFMEAAARSDYCASCCANAELINLSTKDRAEYLANLIPSRKLLARTDTAVLPTEIHYGNLSLCYSNEPADTALTCRNEGDNTAITTSGITVAVPTVKLTRDVFTAACETLLINPIIGQIVANEPNPTPEIAVCGRLDPLVVAGAPEEMECGLHTDLTVLSYPLGCSVPDITVTSSNSDIISVDRLTLIASAPGTAAIRACVSGENKPFFTQNITVKKTIYASELQIVGLDDMLQEGSVIPLNVIVTPADAVDAQTLTWDTSDPAVAMIKDGYLHINSAGSCVVKVSTACTSAEVQINAAPKLRTLKVSNPEIKTSVGHKVPISVQLSPVDAFDADYSWKTNDESVAIVEKEDGVEVVKAVGIGSCTLTCVATDEEISDECQVTVESLMYKKKKGFSPSVASIIVWLIVAYLIYRFLFG